ncbi:hypothetical protein [Bacillus sp. FJAT-49736]|uniref:hypothetical protein n=1 Tax=Bacillus sp. FJAT-49736 TaxID=2833582 RepID=UPI001BCA17B7|nr:hypothetical protein [Bacillus sp. FJAT-49736]MBS4173473.1 hypothetical protein [Bacillus sp. FJAT-49736]
MAKNQLDVEKELKSEREAILAQEKVTITIPFDRNNPVKHQWVSVNGQDFYLAVGKPVEVPKVVADVWQDSYNRTIQAEVTMEQFNEI